MLQGCCLGLAAWYVWGSRLAFLFVARGRMRRPRAHVVRGPLGGDGDGEGKLRMGLFCGRSRTRDASRGAFVGCSAWRGTHLSRLCGHLLTSLLRSWVAHCSPRYSCSLCFFSAWLLDAAAASTPSFKRGARGDPGEERVLSRRPGRRAGGRGGMATEAVMSERERRRGWGRNATLPPCIVKRTVEGECRPSVAIDVQLKNHGCAAVARFTPLASTASVACARKWSAPVCPALPSPPSGGGAGATVAVPSSSHGDAPRAAPHQ